MRKKLWLGLLSFLLLFVAYLVWLRMGGLGVDKSKIGMRKDLYYKIGPTGMEVPFNRIVLIRKGQDMGAFKFTYYEEKCAEYEWYFPLQNSSNKTESGKGVVRDIFVTVIGRLAFQFGNTRIKCGSLKIGWNRYNIVNFYGTEEEYLNASIELAPTNKDRIQDINISDPNLKWYRCTEEERNITIQLDTL